MKSKLLFSIVCFVFSFTVTAQYTNIPDANFELALAAYDDIPNDNQVPTANINTITSLDVSGSNIMDLTGIEGFNSLTTLECFDNDLNSLNVSENPALTGLYCAINKLSNIDVSKNPALEVLFCFQNELTSIDVSANTALSSLNCNNNQLTSLDVTNNTALINLWCYSNDLSSIDVSKNTALSLLRCHNNQLSSLGVTENTKLIDFRCDANQLTSLDVSKNIELTTLYCYGNQLTSLDVTKNSALKELLCGLNPLTSMDVSLNTSLEHFRCPNANLSSLNLKNGNNYNIADEDFHIQNNPSLFCVEVDDVGYSSNNWISYVDNQIEFKNSCDDSLFSEYVIIAEEEVKLSNHNKVLSGKIGVTDTKGKAEFKRFTHVEETVEAAKIYVSNTSNVGNQVLAPAEVDFPDFMENNISNSDSPDVTVNRYQTVELSGSNYGRVKVKKYGKVVFTKSNVYFNELKTERSATVNFTQCANVYINKKLNFHRNTTFNDMGNSVFVYVDDKIQISRGSKITASMYANNSKIKVKAKYYNRTYMKGLFIAEKVRGEKYVTWNKDANLVPCSAPEEASSARVNNSIDSKGEIKTDLIEQLEKPVLYLDALGVKTWPIPSNSNFNIKVSTPNGSEIVLINIYDINGRLVHKDTFNSSNQYQFGNNLKSGVYIVKIIQTSNIKTVRVIKN